VLFLHGGFAFGEDDWEMTKQYRDAGFVVFAPMVRGENGLPGKYTMFFDEVDDVLAAADALAALPYVLADHLYVAGHSVGGTLTMLAAMGSGRFRAAAAFSGSPDQASWSAGQPGLVPFDPSDAGELRIRSPIAFATSFQCPTRLYHGSAERYFAAPTAKLAELAQGAGLDVRAVPVAGDHFSHVPEAIRQSIEFFREKGASRD
jgi:dipeptidyl aminopeptidase/acylaminoacyl peptidase